MRDEQKKNNHRSHVATVMHSNFASKIWFHQNENKNKMNTKMLTLHPSKGTTTAKVQLQQRYNYSKAISVASKIEGKESYYLPSFV